MDITLGDPYCLTCLSTTRNLYPIEDNRFFASLTLLKLADASKFTLCWECDTFVKKAKLFRKKALTAFMLTQKNCNVNIPLSNMGQKKLVNIIDICPQAQAEHPELIQEELLIKEEMVTWSDHAEDPFGGSELERQVNDLEIVKDELDSNSDNETFSYIKRDNISYIEVKHQSTEISTQNTSTKPMLKPDSVLTRPTPGQYAAPTPKLLANEIPSLISNNKNVEHQSEMNSVNIGYVLKELTEKELVEVRTRKLEKLKKKKRLHCDKCLLTLVTAPVYDSHMRNKHSEAAGKYRCEICELRFQTEQSMKVHLNTHYRVYECKLCNEECTSQLEFMKHYDIMHDNKHYKCAHCDQTFSNRKALQLHRRARHGARAACPVCHKMTKTAFMKAHLQSHAPQPPMQCDICHKTYNGANRLRIHRQQTHRLGKEDEDEAAFCVKCNVKFKNMTLYKVHLNQSTKHVREEDQQKCPHCDKKFACQTYLSGHIRRVHVETSGFNCDQCQNTFPSRVSLQRHIRKIHEKRVLPRDKVCHICGKAFFITATLRQHMYSHNNIRPYACEFCGDTFSFSGARHTHIRLKHKGIAGKDKTRGKS